MDEVQQRRSTTILKTMVPKYVLDCVTTRVATRMCYKAIGSSGGRYVALDPFSTTAQYTQRDVRADWLMVYTLFKEPLKLAGVYGRPRNAESREFGARLFPMVERHLEHRLPKKHRIWLRGGGLRGLADGIEDLRMGRVKATKLA